MPSLYVKDKDQEGFLKVDSLLEFTGEEKKVGKALGSPLSL